MTHLGETKITLSGKEVSIKFGMLFWKLLLKHYGKEFHEIGYLMKSNMDKVDFVSNVVLFGHKAYCELNKVDQAYGDDLFIELVNDTMPDEQLSPVISCLLDSKMLGKSLIQILEDSKKKVA